MVRVNTVSYQHLQHHGDHLPLRSGGFRAVRKGQAGRERSERAYWRRQVCSWVQAVPRQGYRKGFFKNLGVLQPVRGYASKTSQETSQQQFRCQSTLPCSIARLWWWTSRPVPCSASIHPLHPVLLTSHPRRPILLTPHPHHSILLTLQSCHSVLLTLCSYRPFLLTSHPCYPFLLTSHSHRPILQTLHPRGPGVWDGRQQLGWG